MYATDCDFKVPWCFDLLPSPGAMIPGMSLEDVANAHWKEYGRNYYARYDYEGVDKAKAEERKCNTIIGQSVDWRSIEGKL